MPGKREGILLIDKHQGVTSYQVIRELRRYYKGLKVGHTGTLDPLATGLLVTVWGKATKIVPFLLEEPKVYEASLLAGLGTDTLDITGKVIEEMDVDLEEDEILSCFASMKGRQEQVPPQYSALKKRGRPLYAYARSGEKVEVPPRPVEIFSIEVLDILDRRGKVEVKFRVCCSKGTYIRSLCRDIGRKLGVSACLLRLRRTRAGAFDLSRAVTLDELRKMFDRGQDMGFISISESLSHLPRIHVGGAQVKKVINGSSLPLEPGMGDKLGGDNAERNVLVVDEMGKPLAVHHIPSADSVCTKVLRVIGV